MLAFVRRDAKSEKTIKYSLSNAAADTPLLRLAQMQGQRYRVERSFEDAKGPVRPGGRTTRCWGGGPGIIT